MAIKKKNTTHRTQKNINLTLLLTSVLLLIVCAAGFVMLKYVRHTKQMPGFITKSESKANVTYNSNDKVNPKTIAGLLNWTRASYVFFPEDAKDPNSKKFTSRNGKYSFSYPTSVYIYEFPRNYSEDTTVLITANEEDYASIVELQNCLEKQAAHLETYCDVPNGDHFTLSITQPYKNFFLTESEVFPSNITTVPVDTDRAVSVWKETAFVEEPFNLTSEIESRVRLGVIEKPTFEYMIKLNESYYKERTYLRISGYAYPAAYPYKQALSEILNSFTIFEKQ